MKRHRRIAYSVTEVAAMLGLSERTVYKLIRAGDLQHSRVGRKILIQPSAITAFLQKGGRRSQ